jgi:multidrug efflux system outer membrane protein
MWAIAGAAVVLGALLASCKVGPDYARPEMPMPTTYKSAADTEAAQPDLTREWWRIFDDPDLNALEDEALKANQTLKAAMARVAEARAATAGVKSQFFPVITMTPSAIRSRKPNLTKTTTKTTQQASTAVNPTATSVSSPTSAAQAAAAATKTPNATTSTLVQVPFDLSYEIDIWGRVRRSYEAAKAQTNISVYDLEVVRQTVLADVAQNYFNLRSLENQAQTLARNLELYRQEIDLTQQQFQAGMTNETTVLQAKVLLDSTLVQDVDIRRQRADIEHAIAILIGRPPVEFTLGVRPLDALPPKTPAGLPADLLRRRPDVAEAEQDLTAACAQIGVAKANFFPVVKLTGAAGFESIDLQHSLDWQNRIWSLGPSMTLPIFEGGQLRASLRKAKARYEELEATYRNTVLTAFSDVENSLTDLHMRADEAEAQGRAVESARDYAKLTHVQFQNGLVNYLQVIDAERTLLTNELSAAQILGQRMVSSVLLMKALGGGWDAQAASEAEVETRQ